MATNETNGISLRRLKTFLTNLKNIFAEKKHSHATSDITGLDTVLNGKLDKNTAGGIAMCGGGENINILKLQQ